MENINYRYQPRLLLFIIAYGGQLLIRKTDGEYFFFRAVARGQFSHNRACNTCYRRDGRPANEIYGKKKDARIRSTWVIGAPIVPCV